LDPGHGARDFRERRVADDEQVNVTIGAELAASRGSEDEGDDDAISERRQRVAEQADGSGGLHEKRLQLREDRQLSVRLEIDLSPLKRPAKHAHPRQRCEFALHRPVGGARQPHDLAQIERLVRVAQQPSEYPKTSPTEQHRRCSVFLERLAWSRTHFAYNRTHTRYDIQARKGKNVEDSTPALANK
jgi:hypothetical protein